MARLVRHSLDRGNLLEGPLTDRIADAGNPVCQGPVAPQLSQCRRLPQTAGMGGICGQWRRPTNSYFVLIEGARADTFDPQPTS